MNPLTSECLVGDIVRESPARSRIFEHLGIDYCCGGKKPLSEVCASRGLDTTTVLSMLNALEEINEQGTEVDPSEMSLAELCDHIDSTHHNYLREELPRLDFMTRKVAAVHGEHEPRLVEIRQVFEVFHASISEHIEEEREAVFPAIRAVDSGADTDSEALKTRLNQLETEHEGAGAALTKLRNLTDSYTPPDWACNTFRALYQSLAELELNMHQHVHKENNVLFPKVLAG